MKLTVETRDNGTVVEVFLDPEGLDFLMQVVGRLRGNEPNHDHLMTESWGSWELTEEQQSDDGVIVHQLNVFFSPG